MEDQLKKQLEYKIAKILQRIENDKYEAEQEEGSSKKSTISTKEEEQFMKLGITLDTPYNRVINSLAKLVPDFDPIKGSIALQDFKEVILLIARDLNLFKGDPFSDQMK